MYVCIDNAIDKMVEILKKEKERRRDARREPDNEKAKFQK
jgi:ribosome-associated translation inhibitor RaiA